jgi:hypothetical protein
MVGDGLRPALGVAPERQELAPLRARGDAAVGVDRVEAHVIGPGAADDALVDALEVRRRIRAAGVAEAELTRRPDWSAISQVPGRVVAVGMRAVERAARRLDFGQSVQRVVLEALVELVQAVVAAAKIPGRVVRVELLLDQLPSTGGVADDAARAGTLRRWRRCGKRRRSSGEGLGRLIDRFTPSPSE